MMVWVLVKFHSFKQPQTLQFFPGKLCPHIDLIMPALPTIALLIPGEEQENVSDAI